MSKLRNERVQIVLVVILALAIRLINYVGPVRGDDFGYLAAAFDVQHGSLLLYTWGGLDRYGLYYPISLFYRLFGVSPLSSVAFPLLSSLVTVVLVYQIGKTLKDSSTGLVAALLWAVFPLDVLNATQVLPDSIVSAYVAGSILLLLNGIRASGTRRFLNWAGMVLLIIIAYYTKEISLINGVFCFVAVLFVLLKDRLVEIYTAVSNRFGRIGLLLLAGLIIGIGYRALSRFIVFPQLGPLLIDPLVVFGQNATDFLDAFFLGVSPFGYELEITQRVQVFDLFIPLFVLALITQLRGKDMQALFLLAWLVIYLMASEWGTEKIGFPTLYITPDPELVLDRRHLMFMFIPVLVVIAMYLSPGFAERKTRKILILGVSLTLVAYAINQAMLAGTSIWFAENVYVVAILAGVSAPLLIERWENVPKRGLLFLLTTLMLLGSLLPVGRYHVSDWYKEKALARNLSAAADFFLNDGTELPIITIPGNNGNLNYASNFQLGFNSGRVDYIYSDARIQRINLGDRETMDFYVVFQDTGRHRELIDPTWELVAQFGKDVPSAIEIYRHFAADASGGP